MAQKTVARCSQQWLTKSRGTTFTVLVYGRYYCRYDDLHARDADPRNSQCPGRQLADAAIWLTLAHVLATVDVSDLVQEDGSPITLETSQSQGPSPGLFMCVGLH